MLKMIVLGAVVLVGGFVGVIGVSDAWDYLRIAYKGVVEGVDDRIPFDAKQGKLRLMISDIEKGLKGSIRKSAQFAVSMKRAKAEVAVLATNLELEKKQMTAIRSRLPGASSARLVSNENLEDLGRDLADRMVTYRRNESLLASKQAAIAELENNQVLLTSSIRERQNTVASLSVRLETIETKSETLKVQTDGDSLPSEDEIRRAQKLADELEMKLEVEQVILKDTKTGHRADEQFSKIESIDSAAAFDTLFGVTIVSDTCVTN